ncbi:DUF5722 domain-containing protein [Aeoliella mucimassa]|uniref:DUF5722 domain-containing protein n=1 Tax=Aeoliella mucimassa TaxID=2527972 RepID=A0A518AMK2_9BACT|nr:DUF5722 domain-containing protein [Aeoliella mucimassa]QDU55948.1 hypothetical protein Pan181_21500 [Aeoliella mucimassa]
MIRRLASLLSGCCFMGLLMMAGSLSQAEQPATPYEGTFPTADSKKGLQVELVDDALALGIRHATLNINLSQAMLPGAAADDPRVIGYQNATGTYTMNGDFVRGVEQQLRPLSDAGVLVYAILLTYESDDPDVNRVALHPSYDKSAPNHLGAFNTETQEGREWLAATIEFLAERWSRPSGECGRMVGYIVGNEVNSHWFWSNCGRVTMEEFAEDYLDAVRIVHTAVRSKATWPRVYLSLEHHWNIRYPGGDELQAFPARPFLEYFAKRAKETPGGDFDWHVAFHPYPENLFEPRFWNDKTATDTPDTPRVTFKNLHILTDYLKQPAMQHEGATRHVLLSEQGFHSTPDKEGETAQAAAYCYAYEKVNRLAGIDAFILHRHIDHPHEGGLNLGLRRRTPGAADPHPKKPMYDCFQAAGTPAWDETSKFALPIVGLESWDEISE